MFAGYNPMESDNGIHRLVSFTLLDNWCSIISDVDTCAVANGCQWCGGHDNNTTTTINNNNTTGVCIKTDSTNQCNSTIHRSNTTSSECSVNEAETRDCTTFTSCSTCKSGFGGNSQRCKWCRCKVCHFFCICFCFVYDGLICK